LLLEALFVLLDNGNACMFSRKMRILMTVRNAKKKPLQRHRDIKTEWQWNSID
jgi:hypothetical protein